jgi:hypothetical protein
MFVPSVDRDGQPIDQERWRDEALTTLGRLFRGGTAFPPGRGVWRDDARGGSLVFDDTVLVTSYAAAAELTDLTLAELRRFLHRMGRDARQGEVGVVIDSTYFGITEYDRRSGEEGENFPPYPSGERTS